MEWRQNGGKAKGCYRKAKVVSRGEGEGIARRIVLGIVRFQGGKRVGVRESRETSESRDRILGGRLRVRVMT